MPVPSSLVHRRHRSECCFTEIVLIVDNFAIQVYFPDSPNQAHLTPKQPDYDGVEVIQLFKNLYLLIEK